MRNVYLALLRGINVGGKNVIRMADLKECLGQSGFEDVATYIASGNVLFSADGTAIADVTSRIESVLSRRFSYNSKVVVVSYRDLKHAVQRAPDGFGRYPDRFRYDVIFLRAPLRPADVIDTVPVREGVDSAYAGKTVLYFSRLIAKASQSRLSKIVLLPVYRELTIRNWATTTALLELMTAARGASTAPDRQRRRT